MSTDKNTQKAKSYHAFVIRTLCDRYEEMSKDGSALETVRAMITILRKNADQWPVDKSNRWLGFIQGCLHCLSDLNVEEERNFTRPYFHRYYQILGIDPPESIEVSLGDTNQEV